MLGVIYGAFAGTLDGVTEAIINSAKEAVNLVIAIAGITAFWTGIIENLQSRRGWWKSWQGESSRFFDSSFRN